MSEISVQDIIIEDIVRSGYNYDIAKKRSYDIVKKHREYYDEESTDGESVEYSMYLSTEMINGICKIIRKEHGYSDKGNYAVRLLAFHVIKDSIPIDRDIVDDGVLAETIDKLVKYYSWNDKLCSYMKGYVVTNSKLDGSFDNRQYGRSYVSTGKSILKQAVRRYFDGQS